MSSMRGFRSRPLRSGESVALYLLLATTSLEVASILLMWPQGLIAISDEDAGEGGRQVSRGSANLRCPYSPCVSRRHAEEEAVWNKKEKGGRKGRAGFSNITWRVFWANDIYGLFSFLPSFWRKRKRELWHFFFPGRRPSQSSRPF